MRNSWSEHTLGELCERVSVGHVGPTSEYFCGEEEGVPLIRSMNVKPGKLITHNIAYVTKDFHKKLKKSQLKAHDILIVRVGENRGDCCVLPEGFSEINCANIVFARPVDKCGFLGYYFRSPQGQGVLQSLSTGSAQGVINTGAIDSIKIKCPDLPTQKKIASILSAYDELIENNMQRIKLLEEMAEEIYKEWFVRMRFPGYQDAKFFDKDGNEVPHGTVGALPEGWVDGKVGDLVEIKKGKNITQSTITEGRVPVVAGGLTPAYYHNTSNTKSPTITISASGANSGFVNLYYEDIWASDCSFIDSEMTEWVFFFYSTLRVRQKEVYHLQKGSAQPHVYPKDIMGLNIKYPTGDLITKFEELIKPFYEEIGILKNKNQVLQETRDLLLPRLISGKLSVEHINLENTNTMAMAAEPEVEYKS